MAADVTEVCVTDAENNNIKYDKEQDITRLSTLSLSANLSDVCQRYLTLTSLSEAHADVACADRWDTNTNACADKSDNYTKTCSDQSDIYAEKHTNEPHNGEWEYHNGYAEYTKYHHKPDNCGDCVGPMAPSLDMILCPRK